MQVLTLESLAKQGALAGKRVLIRSDLNAPRDEAGNITDETRLIASCCQCDATGSIPFMPPGTDM